MSLGLAAIYRGGRDRRDFGLFHRRRGRCIRHYEGDRATRIGLNLLSRFGDPWRSNRADPHGSLKQECVRPAAIESVEVARRKVASYGEHYNGQRLHSAIGYVTPADKLAGLEKMIFAERDRKLEEARQRRKAARAAERKVA